MRPKNMIRSQVISASSARASSVLTLCVTWSTRLPCCKKETIREEGGNHALDLSGGGIRWVYHLPYCD